MRVKVGDITKIKTGKLDANAASEDGEYPFFTCSREPLRISSYSYDCECVLVAGNGDLNVKYYNGKFDAYQRTYIIEDNSDGKLYMPYLYLFMEGYVEELRRQAIGGVIKYIKLGNLTDAVIELPSVEEQKNVVENLFKTKQVLGHREEEIKKLDELIKARFVEMFGRPALNDKKWEECSLAEVCHKITDGEHKNPVFIDEGVPMVMANNVQDNGVTFEGCRFISEEDYKKFSKKCKPEKGDILLVSRGATIGRCCENDTDKEFALMGSVILMKRKKMITSCYLVNWLKNDDIKPLIYTTSAASAQQAIYMKDLSIKRIMLPPVDLQNQFADFVKQVDKSKVAVQKALDEAQLLFDSLMQEYFG